MKRLMNLRSATSIVAEAPGLEATTYAKVDRRLLPFLFLCYILAYLDRVNVGFAKLQMLQDLSLSDAAFGAGAGIFFVGYFLFEVPSNLLLKKFGARTWIARIMVSWGILSSAMMWVKSEWAFYGVRFLLGVAEAGFFPGIIFYLTLWYVFNVTAGSLGLALSAVFRSHPVLAIIFLAIGTLGVIGSMPIFWPVPSTFLGGTAAAAGIGIVNSVGNLGGYVGPNIPVWMKGYSEDPSVSLYVVAGALLISALVAFIAIPDNSRRPARQGA